MAIKWLVPSISRDLRDRMRREAYVTNEIIIRTELLKAQGKLNVMNNVEENPNEPETEDTSFLPDDNKKKFNQVILLTRWYNFQFADMSSIWHEK